MQGIEGSIPAGGTCSNDFSDPIDQDIRTHPMCSELENSGIKVVVGDCSVTERRRWRPPYQTCKTVHVHAKHYKHDEDGLTAPDVWQWFRTAKPIRECHYENWSTHTHTNLSLTVDIKG